MAAAHDPATLASTTGRAQAYAARTGEPPRRLGRFLGRLAPGARILEQAFAAAGRRTQLRIEREEGGGYDGEPTAWFAVTALKG